MKKRAFLEKKSEKDIILSSSNFYQDKDFEVFKELLNKVTKKYNFSKADIFNLAQEEPTIPCSLFTEDLSPLETVVKYLKENSNIDYSRIAELLGRNSKTIWQAHKNALKKYPQILEPADTEYNVPISVFRTSFSILESVSVYLKDRFNLSYHEIGELLDRDERTIWTVCYRAQKKRRNEAR
jgi:DNA-directed RNA polymerase specialized sigma24 family protein